MRIPKQLEPLFDAGLIEDVIRPLMSGKEAAAWIVRSEGEVRCAKVYKEAQSRSFKQRVAYTEGRRVRNSRQARAMAKRSSYGREQEELSWQTTEVDALYKLAAAGVRVPAPVIFSDGVLLMELMLDHNGSPAPRLFDVPLQPEHAAAMLHFLAQQCARMLLAGVVHGDLSEYNVLIAWDGPVIIDLPQAIDASANRNARDVFLRDLDHLTRYLARFSPDLADTEYGREIWNLYETGRLKADVQLTGRGPRRSTRKVDAQQLARDVEEAAEAERPTEEKKRRRKRKRRGSGSGGGSTKMPVVVKVEPARKSGRPQQTTPDAQQDDSRQQRPQQQRPQQQRPQQQRPQQQRPQQQRPQQQRPQAGAAGGDAPPKRRRRRRRRGSGGSSGSSGASSR